MTIEHHLAALAVGLCIAGGCRQDMQDQPKYPPLRPSAFFQDGRSERPLVAGTVSRGDLEGDPAYYSGKTADGAYVRTQAGHPSRARLLRGQERYDIYCSPCHDRVGTGSGMIVERGFRQPPSFHIERLRQAPDGYLFDVITNGFGVMPSYAQQVAVADRWAITAYVRALQLSQGATLADVPPAERRQLQGEAP